MDVVVVPTNKPMIRVDLPDVIYSSEEGSFVPLWQISKKGMLRDNLYL